MATAKSNQGSRLTFAKQANFYTTQTTGFVDVRSEGMPTVATPASGSVDVESTFANPSDKDKPVKIGENVEGAFAVTTLPRQGVSAGSKPFLVSAMEAGGFDATTGNDTTISAYSSTTDFTVTADNFAIGQIATVELDNGFYEACLVADNTAGQLTPAMALSSAASTTNEVRKTWTITPGDTTPIPGADFLTMIGRYRVLNGSNQSLAEGTGCFLSGIGDIAINPQETIKVELTFDAARLQEAAGSTGTALAANSFADSENANAVDCPLFQFAASNASGGIASTLKKIFSATISFDAIAEKIVGVGDTECINNMQGAMKLPDNLTLTIDALYDVADIDEWDGDNSDKYIGIIQRSTSASVPNISFFMPKAYQSEKPQVQYTENNEVRMTTKYKGRPAGFDSTTLPTDLGNQPWYFGLSDRSA